MESTDGAESSSRGATLDNFDELTRFLPRQEGSQRRWGLLPQPSTTQSNTWKRPQFQRHTCTKQQLQCKQPQSTDVLHLHSGNPWISQVFLTAFDIDVTFLSCEPKQRLAQLLKLLQYPIPEKNLPWKVNVNSSSLQLLSDAFPRCPVSEVWEEAQGSLLPPLIPSPRRSPQNPASSHPNYASPFLWMLSSADLRDPSF